MNNESRLPVTKPIPAREVKPGMFIRRPEAVSTSPYAAFREVDRTHNVGIYSQIDIGFVDGTGDTWSLDAEFEVQSDAERATDVAVATVYARLVDAYRVPPAADLPDYLTGENRSHAEDNERRWQVIAGLRNVIEMLIDHPELPTPYVVGVQGGPLSGPWDEQRQIVLDAAEALGQPLDTDEPTQAAVIARLTEEYATPRVTYTVNAMRGEPTPVDEPPVPTRPGYDAHPTILLAPGQTYTDWYARYAAHLDDWCPDWHLDNLDRMAGELADEAQRRREAGGQR